MAALVPCPSCKRHIRIDHYACPFCTAAVPGDFASRIVPSATKRLDRLAMFTFAATLSVAACGGIDDGSPIDGDDAGRGVTPPPAAQDAGGRTGEDVGAPVPMYGLPYPVDASVSKDGGPHKSDGGVVVVDAGPDDDGGGFVLYGLPPPDASYDANIFPMYGIPWPVDAGEEDQ